MNRPALLLVLCLASGCAVPHQIAQERAAVYAEEARFDSLNARPASNLTPAEQAERDSLAAEMLERTERLDELERRDERHRGHIMLAFVAVLIALTSAGAYVVLNSD